MKYFLAEILACPVCKSRDLIVYPVKTIEEDVGVELEKVRCKEYCHYKRVPSSQVPEETCRRCMRLRIVEGVIVCRSCGRWYPIIDTIAWMSNDKYRDPKVDALFAEKILPRLPEDIVEAMRVPDLKSVRG